MRQQTATPEKTLIRNLLIAAMILFAAVIRIIPHPWNLAPVGAMALFSGAVIRNRLLALVVPLLALLAGDLFIGFHILMPVVYGSFLLSIAIGWLLRERRTTQGRRSGLIGSDPVFPDYQLRSVDVPEFLSQDAGRPGGVLRRRVAIFLEYSCRRRLLLRISVRRALPGGTRVCGVQAKRRASFLATFVVSRSADEGLQPDAIILDSP